MSVFLWWDIGGLGVLLENLWTFLQYGLLNLHEFC